MTPILELKNVSAGYDHEVILHQVNLKIYEHDFLGIIGPNGGGKTTLLKVILGLLKPYSGEVIYPVSRQNLFGYLPPNTAVSGGPPPREQCNWNGAADARE